MKEVIFEVTQEEDGGYVAAVFGHSITTQANTLEELRVNVRNAVDLYFKGQTEAPRIIRLHFIRDEILVAK